MYVPDPNSVHVLDPHKEQTFVPVEFSKSD